MLLQFVPIVLVSFLLASAIRRAHLGWLWRVVPGRGGAAGHVELLRLWGERG